MQWMSIPNEDGTKTLVHSDLYDDYLAHYGLPRRSGRYKWGSGKEPYQSLRVRRYQNSDGSLTKVGAKRYQYQRTLNDLDRKTTKSIADYMRTDHAVGTGVARTKKQHAKYAAKSTKRNKRKMDKYDEQLDKNFEKRDKLGYKIDDYGSAINKTAKAAQSSGYKVTNRSVYRNHDKVARIMRGLPSPYEYYLNAVPLNVKDIYNDTVYGQKFNGQTPSRVHGYKWKVKKKKTKK